MRTEMRDVVCCTCARPLSSITPQYDEKTEKPIALDRTLDCCSRVICGNCIKNNRRFATYCPFCQVTTGPSSLPQGLYEPPAYSPPSSPRTSNALLAPTTDAPPPAYSTINPLAPFQEKGQAQQPADDVLHFLDPSKDTIPSLALRYGVPQDALQRKNGLFANHLLAARKTILIPGEFYKGSVSLSPQPVEGDEEEKRKAKIRRWMVACKVSDYDVALLYLEQTKYDLDMAVAIYRDDEKWEKQNPIAGNSIAKGKKKSPRRRLFAGGGSLSGQL